MPEDKRADRPATFGEVFASGEYRALFSAVSLSWVGDYLAKAAVTALVYRQTNSVVASAATFAISFLPWILGGPLLAALAERYPHRTVMILCDVLRMVLMSAIVLPHMPVSAMIVLLFGVSLFNPPHEAARSAMMPRILTGDTYVLGLSLITSSAQATQFVGYILGSAIAAYQPRVALLIDAGTFAFSAVMVWLGVRHRPAVLTASQRTHLLRETGQGYRLVFGTRTLRAIVLLVLSASIFTIPPEGLAAAWAGELTHNPRDRGAIQAMIMMATPLGVFIGSLLLTRLLAPRVRQRLIRPFALLAPAVLIPAVLRPSAVTVSVLAGLCGVFMAGIAPPCNALFVGVLRREYRARAFGVVQSGLQVSQGVAIMITGALASRFALPVVVGLWALAGLVFATIWVIGWPSAAEFAAGAEDAARANAAAEPAEAARAEAPEPVSTGRHAYRPGPATGTGTDAVAAAGPASASGAPAVVEPLGATNGEPINGNSAEQLDVSRTTMDGAARPGSTPRAPRVRSM